MKITDSKHNLLHIIEMQKGTIKALNSLVDAKDELIKSTQNTLDEVISRENYKINMLQDEQFRLKRDLEKTQFSRNSILKLMSKDDILMYIIKLQSDSTVKSKIEAIKMARDIFYAENYGLAQAKEDIDRLWPKE